VFVTIGIDCPTYDKRGLLPVDGEVRTLAPGGAQVTQAQPSWLRATFEFQIFVM
jgi:hypothetical protein